MSGRAHVVSTALAKVPQLTMLPDVAVKVLRIAKDPAASVRDMADVVAHSPTLSTRVLRVVNSPLYGLSGQVSTIDRAISLLGLESVKNVAIAASLTRAFEGRPLSASFSPKDLWLHSLGVAAIARLVATRLRSAVADEAFLAGLIHDVGVTIELQLDRAKLAAILKGMEGDAPADMLELEEQAFGADHQDFGRGTCERWNLPASLAACTGGHHRPLAVDAADRSLASIVFVADRLVVSRQESFKLDQQMTDVPADVLDHLKLSAGDVASIRDAVPAVLAEARTYIAAP